MTQNVFRNRLEAFLNQLCLAHNNNWKIPKSKCKPLDIAIRAKQDIIDLTYNKLEF